MAKQLLGSPGPALMTEEWRRLGSTVLEASMAAFDPIAFIENPITDTELWFFINRAQRQLVIAFRGTVQDSWKDLLTDIQFTPINLDSRHLKDSPRHAHIGKLSAEPGSISKVMETVAQAKNEVELRKKVAEKAASNAAVLLAEEGTRNSFSSSSQSESFGNNNNNNDVNSNEFDDGTPVGPHYSHIENSSTYDDVDDNGTANLPEESKKETEHIVSTAVHAVKSTASDIQEFLGRLKELIDAENGATAAVPGTGECWVHSGFLNAYDSVRGPVLGLIDTALTDEKDPWTIYITGHSLGGALATLCAFDLSHRQWAHGAHHNIVMYNYGSPRVGNKAFAVEFDRAVPNAWRVVNRQDAVVTVPRLMGYNHVGHAVVMGGNKKIEVQKNSGTSPLEGMAMPQLLPAVGAAVMSSVSHAVPAVIKGAAMEIISQAEWEENGNVTPEQLPELWQQEKDAWSALLAGTSIAEHMEEFYFKGIEEAVEYWRASAGRPDEHTNSSYNGSEEVTLNDEVEF